MLRPRSLLPRFSGRLCTSGRIITRRLNSTTPTPAPAPASTEASRLENIVAKFPKRLQPYASRFVNKPISHVTSFLILHEITAVVPLGGLFWLFHTTQWTPSGLPGEWIAAGADRFSRYAKRKGWESFNGEKGARALFELAVAYAVVKATLPLRIGLSLWATPWFARVFVVPVTRLFTRSRP